MSQSALDYLLSRRSVKFVEAPGPDADQLSLILQAAMRAPDHGRLRPWRFALIQNEAIARLADFALAEVHKSGAELSPAKEASTRKWLAGVPLLLAVASYVDPENTRIPERERLLATGVAVGNILNAAHMLGYAAYWSTGLGTYLPAVAEGLGFGGPDYRFMGFVSIGTPLREAPEMARPDYNDFVSEWAGTEL